MNSHVHPGFLKEYHVWDALHTLECINFRVSAAQRMSSKAEELRWLMQNDTEKYFEYFSYLLNLPNKNITMDITPSYASLKRAIFSKIIRGFALRSIECKAIFLLRDPIERCWSSARMVKRNAMLGTSVSSNEVLAYALSRESEIRTRYDITIEELSSSFEKNRLYIGLYEEMFDNSKLTQISEFCDVSLNSQFSKKHINAGGKREDVDVKIKEKIAKHYKSVYDFAEREFPQSKLLWPGFGFL
jgi:hypothetical protein